MFTYIVRCTCKDETLAEEWIAWMREEHLADVCEAGALDGEVIRLESGPGTNTTTCEAHYHFPSREAFNAYQRDHAPRLRAEGLRRFPTERGMSYQRAVGAVVAREEAGKPTRSSRNGSETKAEKAEPSEVPGGAKTERGDTVSKKKTTTRRKSTTKKATTKKK